MASYKDIEAEISKLKKLAEARRRIELKSVIAGIRKLIAEHGLTAEDLGLVGAGKSKASRAAAPKGQRPLANVGVPKYRDPKSLKTWTGRGKPPTWIVKAKNRDAFLIDVPAVEADLASKVTLKAAKKSGVATKTTKADVTAKAKAAPPPSKAAKVSKATTSAVPAKGAKSASASGPKRKTAAKKVTPPATSDAQSAPVEVVPA